MLKAFFNLKTVYFNLLVSLLLIGCSIPNTQKEQHIVGNAIQTPNAESSQLATTEVVTVPELIFFDVPQYTKKPVPIIDLWARMRSGFTLDIDIHNKRIRAQRNWYANNQRYIERVTNRANRYLYHVIDAIEERGMPLELALLPVVESAYDPFAYSHGRASGMWQFIPATGKRFNLPQNWWYDGRRDVVASTTAALDYLSYLHERFDGDWLLALAAYNSGGGNVRNAIKKNLKNNKPTDFWSLDLPQETRDYVPKLIALAQLIADPESYGISLTPLPNLPYFAQVEIGSQIDLAQAAELANIHLDELYLLNPGYNQWATSPDGPHRLNVPMSNAVEFQVNLAKLPPENRVSWIRYQIKSGDTLSTIAQHHRTTTKTLSQINQLKNNHIRAGNVLFIPVASKGSEHYALSAAQRLLAKQERPAARGKTKQVHTVRAGDSFWDLSRKYGAGMREIARWNGMGTTDKLRVGQKLVIWQKPQLTASSASPTADREIIRQVGYRVRQGDSLARIAQKFNVSIASIESWNGISRHKYLQPGQSLKLYVDITRASL